MSTRKLLASAAMLLMGLIAQAGVAHANAIFVVTLDTTALTTLPGSGAGPFAVFFQLTDGSGVDDGNNTATISNFAFGGGSAGAAITTTGGASGNMSGTVTLTDSSFLNSFAQAFTPGSSLSFQVDLTTNPDGSGGPDAFGFSILDSDAFPIPTLNPPSDTLLSIDIDVANPAILTFATDPSRLTNDGAGVSITMSQPTVGPPSGQAPEPGSLLLLLAGLASLLGVRRQGLKPQ